MGGNALKNTYTRRYSRKEYDSLCQEISDLLTYRSDKYTGEYQPAIKFHITTSYKNKMDFGDMDVLIKSSSLKSENIVDVIDSLFSPNEIYSNSDVKSFDYKDFQIDFIMTSDSKWETSINYFSYNDLGNFIGRIAYKMGFRFGHFGLKLVYLHPDGGRKFSKIISKEPRKIYEFLGFSYDRYEEGFDEVEDIFKFVVTSQYFNRKIFDYDQLNHQNRTRNKKRKNYELFLDYVQNSDDVLPFDYEFKSKDEYIEDAEKFFGVELRSEINRWKTQVSQEKKAAGIFNGNVVMEFFPELKGKELGYAMKRFNDYFDTLLPSATEDEKRLYRSRWILDNNLNHILEVFSNVNNFS